MYQIRVCEMTAEEYPTKLPGRWMNVGKGRVDTVVADTPRKRRTGTGHIRDDLHRRLSNDVL